MAAAATSTRLRRRPRPEHVAIAAIVVLAGALRLWSLGEVPGDPFYDASVRSMPLSLHNFLLGAYEPGGSLAVDKPPLDLWLQVLSTQILGFGSVALKLPPALAGTAAVAVLFDAVRRVLGTLAGLGAALALAVLPIALLTSRSDTMDSVAMLLGVVALWLLVRFAHTGRERWCYLAAAAMGLAFNVKLFQGLVPLPALALFGALVCRERRLIRAVASAARVRRRRARVADADAPRPGLRPPVRDRLDQRQRLERGVRLQRLGPDHRRRDRRAAERHAAGQQQRARALGAADRRALAAAAVRAQRPALGSAARLRAARRARARRAGAAVVGDPPARPRRASSARSRSRC